MSAISILAVQFDNMCNFCLKARFPISLMCVHRGEAGLCLQLRCRKRPPMKRRHRTSSYFRNYTSFVKLLSGICYHNVRTHLPKQLNGFLEFTQSTFCLRGKKKHSRMLHAVCSFLLFTSQINDVTLVCKSPKITTTHLCQWGKNALLL